RCRGTSEDDGSGIEAYQFLRKLVVRFGLTERETIFDREILTLDIAKVAEASLQSLNEVGETGGRKIADTRHLCWLLPPRRERPRYRTPDQRDELAPPDHSITSSAIASSEGGTARPSIRAVWRLITSSNLDDCTTGRSTGFVPLRMRPA